MSDKTVAADLAKRVRVGGELDSQGDIERNDRSRGQVIMLRDAAAPAPAQKPAVRHASFLQLVPGRRKTSCQAMKPPDRAVQALPAFGTRRRLCRSDNHLSPLERRPCGIDLFVTGHEDGLQILLRQSRLGVMVATAGNRIVRDRERRTEEVRISLLGTLE